MYIYSHHPSYYGVSKYVGVEVLDPYTHQPTVSS